MESKKVFVPNNNMQTQSVPIPLEKKMSIPMSPERKTIAILGGG